MLFAGTIIGGFAVAGLLQLQKEGHLSWSTLFLICAGVVGLALLLTMFATREVAARVSELAVERAERAASEAPAGKFRLRDVFGSTFGLMLLVVFLNHLGWIGISGQYVNYLNGAFDIDRSLATSVNSVGVLLSLVVIGLVGKWIGEAGPVPALSTGILSRVVMAFALVVIGWLIGDESGAVALPLLVWIGLRMVNPFIELANPVLAARTSVGGAAQAQALMVAIIALAISLGNILNGQLAERVGWNALPWQTIKFCSLAFLVSHFAIRPRLPEGTNEPDPELLLVEREIQS